MNNKYMEACMNSTRQRIIQVIMTKKEVLFLALYKTRIMCYCTNRQPVGRGVNDANRKRSSRAQK